MVKFRFLLVACAFFGSVYRLAGPEACAFGGKGPSEPAGAAADAASVWVTHPDGGKSCSPDSAQTVEDGAADLRRSKVRVLDSRKGSDGKQHAQMCGLPTGVTNAYLIPREDLPQASTLGYVPAR